MSNIKSRLRQLLESGLNSEQTKIVLSIQDDLRKAHEFLDSHIMRLKQEKYNKKQKKKKSFWDWIF